MPGTRQVNWNHILLLPTVSSSAVKTCTDDDVAIDDMSCKYGVVTFRINLPKISLRVFPV